MRASTAHTVSAVETATVEASRHHPHLTTALVAAIPFADGRSPTTARSADPMASATRTSIRRNAATTLAWRQETGELKSVDGRWELEDLGGNRTRATYSLEVDLGRMLSLVIRGPLVDLLRGMLVSARAGELKRAVESG